MAQQPRNFDNPIFREIHKNTWLKKVNIINDSKKVARLLQNIRLKLKDAYYINLGGGHKITLHNLEVKYFVYAVLNGETHSM